MVLLDALNASAAASTPPCSTPSIHTGRPGLPRFALPLSVFAPMALLLS
jgi:hypothetical protein